VRELNPHGYDDICRLPQASESRIFSDAVRQTHTVTKSTRCYQTLVLDRAAYGQQAMKLTLSKPGKRRLRWCPSFFAGTRAMSATDCGAQPAARRRTPSRNTRSAEGALPSALWNFNQVSRVLRVLLLSTYKSHTFPACVSPQKQSSLWVNLRVLGSLQVQTPSSVLPKPVSRRASSETAHSFLRSRRIPWNRFLLIMVSQ